MHVSPPPPLPHRSFTSRDLKIKIGLVLNPPVEEDSEIIEAQINPYTPQDTKHKGGNKRQGQREDCLHKGTDQINDVRFKMAFKL